jgi:hypothetical protein
MSVDIGYELPPGLVQTGGADYGLAVGVEQPTEGQAHKTEAEVLMDRIAAVKPHPSVPAELRRTAISLMHALGIAKPAPETLQDGRDVLSHLLDASGPRSQDSAAPPEQPPPLSEAAHAVALETLDAAKARGDFGAVSFLQGVLGIEVDSTAIG